MEGSCSTGQSPQWAVVPVEEEEVYSVNYSSFLTFFLRFDLFLSTYTRCIGLLLHFITLSDIYTHRQVSCGQGMDPSQSPLPHNTQHSQQIFTPPAGFEPAIPARGRPQTYALDRATTQQSSLREINTPFSRDTVGLFHVTISHCSVQP
jgi:hypothetical protein